MLLFALLVYMVAIILVTVKTLGLLLYEDQPYDITNFFTVGLSELDPQYKTQVIHTMLVLLLFGIIIQPLVPNLSMFVLSTIMGIHAGLGIYRMINVNHTN